MCRTVICMLVLAALACSQAWAAPEAKPAAKPADKAPAPKPTPAEEITEARVSAAIDKIVKYLFSAVGKDGHWDTVPIDKLQGEAMQTNYGGKTALALAALASAGQQSDPRFQKALDWLVKQNLRGNYAIGLRLQTLSSLGNSKPYREVILRDAAALLRAARRDVTGGVTWQYLPPPDQHKYAGTPSMPGDYSNVNYAVLGLWAAEDEGAEVPTQLWQGIERTWTAGQHAHGGWSYFPGKALASATPEYWSNPTGSMTTAGIASLYLVLDRYHAPKGQPGSFRNTPAYLSIQKGLDWLDKNWSATTNKGRPEWATYYFYNVERVGTAAGLKYIGTRNWFQEIGKTILSWQQGDGSIKGAMNANYGGVLCDSAYSLLFLAKGSAPVLVNKLQHAADWDNRVRELAGLCDWTARQWERPANWQVVNLKVAPEELSDSRLLLISGSKPLEFKDEDIAKLKRYVDLGGLLIFHPDMNSPRFTASVEKLLASMWPDLKLVDVDLKTDPLVNSGQALGTTRYTMKKLATPVRPLAVLIGGDAARAWEHRDYVSGKAAFQIMASLHNFITDRAAVRSLPTKLVYFAQDLRVKTPAPAKKITVATVQYGQNDMQWKPEPLAMEYLAAHLASRDKVALETKVVALNDLGSSGVKVALMTGCQPFELEQGQLDALKSWLQGGGTLIVDQAGGPSQAEETFDKSFRAAAEAMFGKRCLQTLSSQQAWIEKLGSITYRNVAGQVRQKMLPSLQTVTIDDRPAIVYSRYDLTASQMGVLTPQNAGPDADSAHKLLSSLILGATTVTTPASGPKSLSE